MSNNKDKSFDRITKTIVNKSNYIAKKKIDKAQYDKSYNAVILGVNQNFVDDVPDKDKSELISKHSIPETADNGKYYTFKINGVYYVKKSNTDFKLYENVVIRIPNGNWNNMFIEVQRDTVNDSTEPSPAPSPSTVLGQVSFEKNRLYYNGETYHLQFGHNKRIMCVTKGDKYALINSPDYTGSRIEAATAVMNGLTEDWDLEFDCDDPELSVSAFMPWSWECSSGDMKREYINGRLKIKFLKSVPDPCRLQFNFFMGGKMRENGNYLHIGGQFRNIDVYCNLYAEHITFGENIRKINELEGSIWSAPTKVKNGHQHGIPPFVESIGSPTFLYSGSGYIYIPESCANISSRAFEYNSAAEIEIEEKGESINIAGAFYKNGSENSASRVQVIKIPARVLQNNPKTFAGSGAGAVVFEEGCTEIKFSDMGCIYNTGSQAMINHLPFYIFIPSTVTSIGDLLASYPSNSERKVFIIYEGSESSWNSINKASNWNGGNNDVTVICDGSSYRNYENIVNRLVKKG